MPRNQSIKTKDEHLIFVKNVPADMVEVAVRDLFEQYEPECIKNVYPNSDITTVVISFRTNEEAAYAQQDTDGMRLDNVVLRVEMYSKNRSVRYLREERNANRPLGADDEKIENRMKEGQSEDKVPDIATQIEPMVAPMQHGAPGGGTWAQVAGKKRPLDMRPLPALASVLKPQTPMKKSQPHSPVQEVTVTTPRITVAVPRLLIHSKAHDTLSERLSVEDISNDSLDTSPTLIAGYEGGTEETRKFKKSPELRMSKDSIFSSNLIDTTDTTQRIRQLHCRDCAFCNMRMRC